MIYLCGFIAKLAYDWVKAVCFFYIFCEITELHFDIVIASLIFIAYTVAMCYAEYVDDMSYYDDDY